MAVEDKYTDSNLASGDKRSPLVNGGSSPMMLAASFEVAAADDDGSVYRIGKIRANEALPEGKYLNDAITGGTDYDFGIYKEGVGGAAVKADLFVDGASVASASTHPHGDLTSAVDIADKGKTVGDLLTAIGGITFAPNEQFDLAWTANTVGTVAGTLTTIATKQKQG